MLEEDLDKVVAGFDESLKAAEEELAKLTPEGDENALKQKIDQSFQVDKKTHEALQKIVSQVEKGQMNLNQAKAKVDQEKVVYDKSLGEKMANFHGKCDDSVKELKQKLHDLLQSQVDAIEEEIAKVNA